MRTLRRSAPEWSGLAEIRVRRNTACGRARGRTPAQTDHQPLPRASTAEREHCFAELCWRLGGYEVAAVGHRDEACIGHLLDDRPAVRWAADQVEGADEHKRRG